ncbi:hypothetical protein [Amycolatopsis sp. NPDC057786]|uniref:hypothetical protein n=1 Tax=Amycolatopsis sp. NPDC057786 TaxID=3346250 RepID=UPI00366E689F
MDALRHVIETGLDLTGKVQGRLHGRFPSVEGDWLGELLQVRGDIGVGSTG